MKNKKFYSVLAFCLCAISLFGLTACGVSPKTFSTIGLKITLDSSFKETPQSGFNMVLSSRNIAFFVNKEDFETLENNGYSNAREMSLQEYAQLIVTNNNLSSTVHESDNGIVNFEYHKNVSGNRFIYFAIVKKGSNSFWLCQFAMLESDFNDNIPQFLDWAETIVVE